MAVIKSITETTREKKVKVLPMSGVSCQEQEQFQAVYKTSTRSKVVAVLVLVAAVILLIISKLTYGAVLDPDRADVLYHSYQGGGMKIDGPAVLIRKKANDNVAVSAYYYVDTISSASVDVLSTASPYSEERKEFQLGAEYLHDKTVIAVNVGQSDESDYLAKSVALNIAHDTFGDLTTVSLGVVYGDNEIKRNGDDNFLETSQQYRIRAGINQILTPSLTAGINIEAVADEGYLNNPYRTVRFIDNSNAAGVGFQGEVYPDTRNSFAVKLSSSYYLPYRAALFANYRYFTDSWDIESQDFELAYRQPFWGDKFELEMKARVYQQTAANFYSDLFPFRDAQNFLARDKELSDFDDLTLGLGLTYKIPSAWSPFNWQSEASFQWDHLRFNYNNFRNPNDPGGVGAEPLYRFSANVVRAFVSVYF
ncbi:DUF3570 domain-containing protein [Endozoicomonas sp. G2_1]|uniref:DUF3570 domain-containing protein n=1 Tax=Endozoicomonas sp. G2_1 TaxID=2821091 RepID=UPI001AD9EADA|nr:DUF3570 domain-containing protein [Endozoicomonas sp. G2_1]